MILDDSVGPDPRAVVLILKSAYLHVKISVKVFRVYLGMVTIFFFGARLCWGRGGGNVTFHGIYMVSRGNHLSLVSVMHLWATLGCGVFSCRSNLVWPVRGSLGAPSMKSVAHRPLCA